MGDKGGGRTCADIGSWVVEGTVEEAGGARSLMGSTRGGKEKGELNRERGGAYVDGGVHKRSLQKWNGDPCSPHLSWSPDG